MMHIRFPLFVLVSGLELNHLNETKTQFVSLFLLFSFLAA